MSASSMATKEVLVVGLGAVGAIYSLILKQSGRARVSVIARSNYEIVKSEGLNIKSRKYGVFNGWKPDAIYKSIKEATTQGTFDYVVLATKAIPELTSTPELLEPLLNTASKQPTYVLLQNGLGVEKELYDAVKKIEEPKIVSAAVWIGTNLVGPNKVEHGDFDRLTLGIYRQNDHSTTSNSVQEQEILDDIGGLLKDGGSEVTIVPEIQRMKFAKNFWNVAFSSVTTLTGYALPAIFRPAPSEGSAHYAPYVHPSSADAIRKYTIPQIEAVLNELVILGRALGYPDSPDALPSSLPKTILENTGNIHARADSSHKPSMMLDMEKGQPMEVEVILGEVVRLAHEVGITVPRVEMLYALLLVVQNQILRRRAESS